MVSDFIPVADQFFQTIVCALGYLFVNISFQGLSLFLPTVINSCKSLRSAFYLVN